VFKILALKLAPVGVISVTGSVSTEGLGRFTRSSSLHAPQLINIRAGGGITYGNECAEFDLSVSRRFTASDNLPPATSIAFGVQLAGLGEGGDREWPARACALQGI
jgi:hypothetical protein